MARIDPSHRGDMDEPLETLGVCRKIGVRGGFRGFSRFFYFFDIFEFSCIP